MTIREVSMDQILPIRQQVMWPKKSIYFVRIPDDSQGLHFGLLEDEKWSLWCLFLFRIVEHNSGNLPLWNFAKERVMDQIFFSLFFFGRKKCRPHLVQCEDFKIWILSKIRDDRNSSHF